MMAMLPRWERPLWICPACGNAFANRNNWHSCVRVPLDTHFHERPKARALFECLRKAVELIGPARIVSSKTRICFMARVRFASCSVRKDWLRAGMWLPYPVEATGSLKKEFIPPRYHLLTFAIREPRNIDGQFRRLLRESYGQAGRQEHLQEQARRKGR